MADSAYALLDHSAELALEADPSDWVEQRRPVLLPDDDYPHSGTFITISQPNR